MKWWKGYVYFSVSNTVKRANGGSCVSLSMTELLFYVQKYTERLAPRHTRQISPS